MREAPHILIVEDDPGIQRLLEMSLRKIGYTCDLADTATGGYTLARANNPDLILLDLGLPDYDGVELLARIRQRQDTPVLVVSARGQEKDKIEALDAGADDYVTKPFGVMELLSRIRAVLRRCGGGREKVVSCREVTVDYERRTVAVGENGCELTYKEFELLYYMICNRGVVLSRDKIMDAVWGFDFEGESRTVDMHIKTLRQKLERAGAHDLIKTVRSVGYKIEG